MGTAIYRREKIRPEKAGSRFPGFIPYRKRMTKASASMPEALLRPQAHHAETLHGIRRSMRRRLQRRGWIPAFQRSSRLPDWTAGTLRFRMETPQWPLANRQQSRRLELGQRRRSDSLARPCSTGDGLRFIHSSSSCGRIGFNVLSVLLHTKTGTCGVALAGSASI